MPRELTAEELDKLIELSIKGIVITIRLLNNFTKSDA